MLWSLCKAMVCHDELFPLKKSQYVAEAYFIYLLYFEGVPQPTVEKFIRFANIGFLFLLLLLLLATGV